MKIMLRKCRSLLMKLHKSRRWNTLCYRVRKLFSHNHLSADKESARRALQAISPKPTGSPFARNELAPEPEYNLQIIVPAYNAEAYLHQCMDSILRQPTRYRIQVTVINDGSRDRTGQIADSYTDPRVRVLHLENGGAAAARNAALKQLNAKYIMFVDADDWIMDGAIDALMDAALEKDADIVQAGYHYQTGDDVYPVLLYPAMTRVDDPAQLYGFPVGKVYRSSLWANLQFPEGFWFEDTVLSFLLFPRVENAWLIPGSVYVYRQNTAGSTATARAKPKSLDACWITETLLEARQTLGLDNDARFQRKFFGQILLNAQRIAGLPEDVRKNAFILTCQLYERHFSGVVADSRYRDLKTALLTRDYGLFTLYSRYHRFFTPNP